MCYRLSLKKKQGPVYLHKVSKLNWCKINLRLNSIVCSISLSIDEFYVKQFNYIDRWIVHVKCIIWLTHRYNQVLFLVNS